MSAEPSGPRNRALSSTCVVADPQLSEYHRSDANRITTTTSNSDPTTTNDMAMLQSIARFSDSYPAPAPHQNPLSDSSCPAKTCTDSRGRKGSPSPGSRNRPEERSRLAQQELAYGLPTNAPILIPRCVLQKAKASTRRVLTASPSDRARQSSVHIAEQDAVYNPVAPVNRDTMKEIELPAIQNNLCLRIDLCYDDQLFFQPIKGRKGKEKQSRARVFWDCLSVELQSYRHFLSNDCPECAQLQRSPPAVPVEIPSRLACFFSALRELIAMLIPEKDRGVVLEKLVVDELVVAARVGRFNAVDFSAWLAQLLMMHCAPLRDDMAKRMQRKVSEGAINNNMDLLVDGLETMLSLLENMKLDVANHQVRSFKQLLIADTVPFLKDCFTTMRNDGTIQLETSLEWYKAICDDAQAQGKPDFECFVRGAVEFCRSPYSALPSTFSHDKERLTTLRNEVHDLTSLRVCMRSFADLMQSQQQRCPTATENADILDRLMMLVSSEDGTSEGVDCHLEEIATELVRESAGVSKCIHDSKTGLSFGHLDIQSTADLLQLHLDEEHSSVLDQVLVELADRTLHYTSVFGKLNTLQLSNTQRIWTSRRSLNNFTPAPDIEDMARRLAHIFVIHWAVWSEVLYLEEEQEKDTLFQ